MNELAPFESFLKELVTAYRTKYAVQFNKNFPVEGKNAVPMLKHCLVLLLTNYKEA